MDLHGKIRELMEARHWSVYRLAKESGVSWSTIRNMFDRNTEPTVSTLEALCNGLGITLTQLLLGDGYPELTPDQKEVLMHWNSLSPDDKQLFLNLLRSFGEKK